MNRYVERLTPFWDWWSFRGGPFLQLFDGGFAGDYDREDLGDGFEPWFAKICLKCLIELLRVFLNKECKLKELLPAVLKWKRRSVLEGSLESRVYLGGTAGRQKTLLIPWQGTRGRTSSTFGYEDMMRLVRTDGEGERCYTERS